VTRDSRKLLGTIGCKRLALNQKLLGRKTEEARAQNKAVMPQQQYQQQQ
jgi:hypothetical protein